MIQESYDEYDRRQTWATILAKLRGITEGQNEATD